MRSLVSRQKLIRRQPIKNGQGKSSMRRPLGNGGKAHDGRGGHPALEPAGHGWGVAACAKYLLSVQHQAQLHDAQPDQRHESGSGTRQVAPEADGQQVVSDSPRLGRSPVLAHK